MQCVCMCSVCTEYLSQGRICSSSNKSSYQINKKGSLSVYFKTYEHLLSYPLLCMLLMDCLPSWLRTWWPVWHGWGRVGCRGLEGTGPRRRSVWPPLPLCSDKGPTHPPQSPYTAWTACGSHSAWVRGGGREETWREERRKKGQEGKMQGEEKLELKSTLSQSCKRLRQDILQMNKYKRHSSNRDHAFSCPLCCLFCVFYTDLESFLCFPSCFTHLPCTSDVLASCMWCYQPTLFVCPVVMLSQVIWCLVVNSLDTCLCLCKV